jgi:hypothetical protein
MYKSFLVLFFKKELLAFLGLGSRETREPRHEFSYCKPGFVFAAARHPRAGVDADGGDGALADRHRCSVVPDLRERSLRDEA